MRMLSLMALASLIFADSLHSQTNGQRTRIQVYVSASGDDAVGQALAYSVREELRRSAAYDVGASKDALLTVHLISLDLANGDERRGSSSAVAVTFTMSNLVPYKAGDPQTWYPIFLNSSVLLVGRNRVDQQAKSVVADLDSEVERFRGQIK